MLGPRIFLQIWAKNDVNAYTPNSCTCYLMPFYSIMVAVASEVNSCTASFLPVKYWFCWWLSCKQVKGRKKRKWSFNLKERLNWDTEAMRLSEHDISLVAYLLAHATIFRLWMSYHFFYSQFPYGLLVHLRICG